MIRSRGHKHKVLGHSEFPAGLLRLLPVSGGNSGCPLATLFFLFCIAAPSLPAQSERGTTRSPHGPLALACENCHTSTNWSPIRPKPDFNHNQTPYPLRGVHEKVACRTCHTSLVFSQVGTTCADCHADIHRRQFGGDCQSCHSVRGWAVSAQAIKEHANRFPLLGAHAAVDCEACHKGAAVARFTGLSTACVSCHAADLQSTSRVSFDHQAAQLTANCDMCHSMDSWLGARFDHARFAGFPLSGAHSGLDCATCHVGNRFKGTPADCFSCHAKDFQSAQNPNHVTANFPSNCSLCHRTDSWLNARFDHNQTRFPLTGAHTALQCASCHANGNYTLSFTGCASCHQADFQKTTNPNHATAGFPQDCTICHTTTAWQPASFDHSKTGFLLSGAHAPLPCASCHINGKFAGTPATCTGCHLADYSKTTDPNHAAAGFPQDCSLCHSTTNWAGATFNHNTATKFPLQGAHATAKCVDCHSSGVYAGLSTACVSCHLSAFTGTTNPNHTAAGFPQDCSICHTTTAWQPATFDHSKTPFPLTGAHKTVPCANCHVAGKFAGTPTDCYSCHTTEYKSTTNPNHAAAGFPTTCQTCHSTTSWAGATFNHTWFPVPHRTARLCTDCHTNPSDYSVFVCTNCHTQSQTDPEHRGVRGYVWNSANCYQCHPRGTGG